MKDKLSNITYQLAKKYTNTHGGGGGGTSNYNALTNKPTLNNVTLQGTMTSTTLGLQDVLTEGDNITIDNNVISAEIEANPTGTATDELSSLRVGTDIYSLPEGTEAVEMSYADYQLLTPAEKEDGTVRYIPDYPSQGGGGAELESDVTANTTVGAIGSGTTLAEGTTFTEFVQKLLISEIAPTTTFSASGSGTKEAGTSVTPTLTLVINTKGTGTPTSIKFYNGSTLLDTQAYVDGTNSYSYTMTDAITTNTTVKGVLEYTKSDSTSGTIEKSASYTFVMASYYGAVSVAPTDKAGITALTKNVKTNRGQTATFNLSNQRSCYCYPASMGNLTSILDGNNFQYIGSYTKTTVSVDGETYNVYTLTDPVTATGFKQTYA